MRARRTAWKKEHSDITGGVLVFRGSIATIVLLSTGLRVLDSQDYVERENA